MTKEKFESDKENGNILQQIRPNHKFTSNDGAIMCKLHVDTYLFIQTIREIHHVTGKWG